jgi:hypothetical protein
MPVQSRLGHPFATLSAPGVRGYDAPAGGLASYVEAPVEYYGPSNQICGLWPHVAGVGHPTVGVPVGRHLHTGSAVCCDPINWFKAGLIPNPGMSLLGLTGRGKSSYAASMLLGLMASGVKGLILGDLKPDYAGFVQALGGDVVKIGRGHGSLNMLDPGTLLAAARRLPGEAGEQTRAEAIGRAQDLTVALLEVYRRNRLDSDDETVLREAVKVLLQQDRIAAPVLADLVELIATGPDQLRHLTLTAGDPDEKYRAAVHRLHRNLVGFAQSDFGTTFGRATTTHLDLDASAVCVDISGLSAGRADERLLAGVLLATWATGFAAVEAAQTLADHGLAPRSEYLVVMDEIWQVLRSSPGMVERVDALTRLNRTEGVANVLITHTFKDFDALPQETDRAKARGFVERSGLIVTGEVAQSDLGDLDKVVGMSGREIAEVRSWGVGQPFDHRTGQTLPPSVGKFLIKASGAPGIPIKALRTTRLAQLMNTAARWDLR